jgi:RHS repeat-associated protein
MPSDWNTISYVYDPGGRRIEKKYDGQAVMKYLYDGDSIIAEYDATGALVHKYIYGPGVDQPICMIDVADANATYYYHFDGLGSVIALTDSAGAVANLYEYSIFGEVSASDPNHPNRFLFTGREFDTETGLYYYRARYYNATIGRFLQTDPAGGKYLASMGSGSVH